MNLSLKLTKAGSIKAQEYRRGCLMILRMRSLYRNKKKKWRSWFEEC